MPSEQTIAKALDALDGMAQIVRNEMIVSGVYLDPDVDPSKSGAICQGHRACAVGSLWLGGGVKVVGGNLPGVHSFARADFLRPRHGLRTAYDALNAAAQRFAERRGIRYDEAEVEDFGWMETLFEEEWDIHEPGERLTREDLLRIIAAAKRRVNAMRQIQPSEEA